MKKSFLWLWDNPCQAIYTMMALLIFAGGINVYSASYITARDMFGNPMHFLLRYFIFALIGLFGMWLVRRIGYKILLNKSWTLISCVIIVGMLFLVDVIGVATKGASRWLYLGPISIQPSEFAKLSVIMLCARTLGTMMRKGKRVSLFHKGDDLIPIGMTILYALLVYKQPDLGTAAIICGLMLGMYIVAGIPLGEVFVVGCGAVAGAVGLAIAAPYRLERLKVWADPWLDEAGTGYQMVQSLLAIGSGGLTGTHWGHGASKFFYLPEAHTDFAFAVFCQENGLLGATYVMVLFAIMGCAFCKIATRTRDHQGFLLASGVTFLIIGQAVANMAMVCGILPVIGVPLVFISYGGSSMVLSMAAIGLLLSVYDREVQQAELEAVPPEERRDDLRVVRNGRWNS